MPWAAARKAKSMPSRLRHLLTLNLRRFAVVAAVLLALQLRGGDTRTVSAQSSPPPACSPFVIANLVARSTSSANATIAFNTPNCPSTAYVEYGPTQAYGQQQAPGDSGTSTTFTIFLSGLTPGTTYHYRVVATDASGTQTIQSTNRSFPTPAATSDDPPTVFDARVDSIDTSATIFFKSTQPATAIVRFGLAPGPWDGERAVNTPGVDFSVFVDPLTSDSVYFYQIVLTGTSGTYTTDALTFRTSGSPFDHIFTTGECPDGIALGQCHPVTRQFCEGGTFVTRCDRCGADCPTGSTCRVGGGCDPDPSLTGNAFQCNKDECYIGAGFRRPAPPGCWVTWPRCSANIVLKVQRDRVCEQWMSCTESQQVTNQQTGTKEDICTNLGGCSSLGPGGTCNQFLGQGQCTNDPLKFCNSDLDCPGASCVIAQSSSQHYRPVTFRTPDDVDRIKNLSGAIVAGLDWGTSEQIIEGQYPWFLAPQWGNPDETINLNGDFERPARSLNERGASLSYDPWKPSDANHFVSEGPLGDPGFKIDFENKESVGADQGDLNHVLKMKPKIMGDAAAYASAPAQPFRAYTSYDYFVKLRLRTATGNNVVRIQFWNPDTSVPTNLATVTVTGQWQEYRFGPVNGLNGNQELHLYFPPARDPTLDDPADGDDPNVPDTTDVSENEVYLDDVSLTVGLEIRPSEYVFPTCRLYPREDAEACTFTDENSVRYRGQSGYCLERDPRNPAICISWWPVDAIRGEENVFATNRTAGFTGGPVYMCVQSRLYTKPPTSFWASERYDRAIRRCVGGGNNGGDCSRGEACPGGSCQNNPNYGAAVSRHGSLCVDASGQGCDRSECRNNALRNPARWTEATMCPPGFKPVGQLLHDQGYRCGRSCERRGKRDGCEYQCILKTHTGDGADPLDPGEFDAVHRILNAYSEYTGRVYSGMLLQNQCAVVAKVADVSQNGAWAARTARGSSYDVGLAAGTTFPIPPSPLAQYPEEQTSGITVDYPFGRLVPPNVGVNPTAWTSIPIRTTCETSTPGNPMECAAGKTPGAVPGALPFAWSKPARPAQEFCTESRRDQVCTDSDRCSIPFIGECTNDRSACDADLDCRAGAQNKACTTYVDSSGTPVTQGRCGGLATGAVCELSNVCQNTPTIRCSSTPGSPDAVCGGACAGGADNGEFCTSGATCVSGICTPGALSICTFPDYQCNQGATCTAGICSNSVATDGSGRCTKPEDNSASDQACTTNDECTQSYAFCEEVEDGFDIRGRCRYVNGALTDIACSYDSDCTSCEQPTRCTQNTDCLNVLCEPDAGVQGTCPDGATQCRTGEDCYAPTENVCTVQGRCDATGGVCNNDGDCRTPVFCQDRGSVSRCFTSENIDPEELATAVERLKRIFVKHYGVWLWDTRQNEFQYVPCSAGSCGSYAATASSPYAEAGGDAIFQAWVPPTTACASDRDPTLLSDYCGNPPAAFNASWAGGETSVTIHRGEQVTLRFNTRVDLEQKPLQSIAIDWKGDGSNLTMIRTYPFRYDAKDNVNDPHVFKFAYQIGGPSAQTFSPRVLVKDNWGWCSNGRTGAPCDETPGTWSSLGLQVTVE